MFNERIFETIDAKEKAYWLGFIYADGNVSTKGNRIGFCLNKKDVVLLERFCDFVGGDRNRIVSYNDKNVVYYYVYSKDMKDDLSKHNILPDKTHKKEFPIIDDYELFLAFFLGVYDGDGSEGKSQLASGNKEFLEYCCKRFDIDINKIILKKNKYGSAFYLCVGYRKFIEILQNYQYSLERKRRTVDKHFNYGEEPTYTFKNRKFEVSKEELENLVSTNTVLEIAKMFGVTYNSISKRCKLLKIEFVPIVKNRKSKNVNPM